MAIITLTTDLGHSDYYVGAVKGKLLSSAPDITIVDISHLIKAFDPFHAAFVIKNAYRDFPAGTVHLINVESENIKSKRFLLVKHKEQYFIGHDNGIFSLVFDNEPEEVYELDIENPEKYTFPLRDVMAVTACKLIDGKDISSLARRTYNIQGLNILQPAITENSIRGNVIYIDHYDNVMVNITQDEFNESRNGRKFTIYFKRNEYIYEISDKYDAVPEGEKLAFFNAAGYLEIAINKGKAGSLFGLKMNDTVQIDFE